MGNFEYLGVTINEDKSTKYINEKESKQLKKHTPCYRNFFRNKNITRKLKLILKNTIIDKSLTYASETWILTKRDRKQINIFERKVYRRIFWPSI